MSPQGDAVEWEIKAWQHLEDDLPVVLWEFRRIADAMGCLVAGRSASKWFTERLPLWRAQWAAMGIAEGTAYVLSQKSQVARARARSSQVAMAERTHDELTLTTVAVLAVVLCASFSLHKVATRNRCLAFLQTFFGRSLPNTVVAQLGWGTLGPRDFAACAGSADGRPCAHLKEALASWGGDCPEQQRLAQSLSDLHVWSSECSACRCVLRKLSHAIAAMIDDRLESFAYTDDPTKATPLDEAKKKKRRIDEDLKASVTIVTMAAHRAPNPASLLRATANYSEKNACGWVDRTLLQYQGASWFLGAQTETVVVSADASRVGNPGENVEVLAAQCFAPGSSSLVFLPPQVLLGLEGGQNQ